MCEKDTAAIFLIEQKTWLYHNVLFAGYWDSHDNKLVSIVAEPYSRVVLNGHDVPRLLQGCYLSQEKKWSEQTVMPKQEQQQ